MIRTPNIKLIFLLILSTLCVGSISAQFKDTVLNAIASKPFFYNILKGENNKVFAGTSDGIFEISGTDLRHYGSERGYITLNQKGEPIIDKNGIKFHRSQSYSHLLPYAELGTERSFHVGLDKVFYLCSGGRLMIFDILPWKIDFQNHSIRSISKDLVGTYSGVYLKGKKLFPPAPPFVDGNVRQIGNRGFICSYSLLVLEKDAMETGQLKLDSNCLKYVEPDGLLISDIVLGNDKRTYYIATFDKLILADYYFKKDTVLYKKKDKNLALTLIPGDPERLFFAAGRELMALHYSNQKISSLIKVEDEIQDARFLGFQIYFITKNALYVYDLANKTLKKLSNLEQAHTIETGESNSFLISSNMGLFYYSLPGNKLSTIIKNVEFNKGAIYNDFHPDPRVSVDNISVGSINGLYTFRLSDVPEMIASNIKQNSITDITNGTIMTLASLCVLLLFLLIATIIKSRKKLKSAQSAIEELQGPKKVVTREIIEAYIENNLATASIKTLTDEFGMNAPQLYNVLKPERPGSIIQKLRIDKVKAMREKNHTVKEIAAATGLSEIYLKRIKT